ncbi:MAG: HD domain-containing protein [Pseudomonadota bacterium]
MILEAAQFAAEVHTLHRTGDGNTPLINHVLEVAELVSKHTDETQTIVAALLHGVVEDSELTIAQLRDRFGGEIASIVGELTDNPRWATLSSLDRKRHQAQWIATASPAAQTIKLADRTCNARDKRRLSTGLSDSATKKYIDSLRPIVANCSAAPVQLAALFDQENPL